ncbi:MAG: PilZ domain-containing protein [Planctomycetota bacterium]
MSNERRQYRRLPIRLPLEFFAKEAEGEDVLRTVTRDVSTNGLYFELPLFKGVSTPKLNSLLNVELTVPPGDGYFPYVGRVTSVAEVVRCEPLPVSADSQSEVPPRIGIGARFQEPLKLVF